MSLELRLLPVDRMWAYGHEGLCHTILNAPCDYDMFDEIRALNPTPLPEDHMFTAHLGDRRPDGEPQYGKLTTDSYGGKPAWLPSGILGGVIWKRYPAHPVAAYLMALPGDTRVILDWH